MAGRTVNLSKDLCYPFVTIRLFRLFINFSLSGLLSAILSLLKNIWELCDSGYSSSDTEFLAELKKPLPLLADGDLILHLHYTLLEAAVPDALLQQLWCNFCSLICFFSFTFYNFPWFEEGLICYDCTNFAFCRLNVLSIFLFFKCI